MTTENHSDLESNLSTEKATLFLRRRRSQRLSHAPYQLRNEGCQATTAEEVDVLKE